MSLTGRIVVGLLAGVGCGLFFGELCSFLAVIGDGFVNLLQMTVLPYITCSLILNIGRLAPLRARRVARLGAVVILVLWAIAAATIVVAPLALPEVGGGSFFSVSQLRRPEPFDLVSLYIPANPFHSLANTIVPAVVVFCIFLGAALIGLDRKDALLEPLDAACRALVRINGFVIRLTPYGLFAIAAAAAGTMTVDQLERLEAYFLMYAAASAVLTFWALPLLISALTQYSFRQILGASRDALITAFATGKTLVVLPMLVDGATRLFQEAGRGPEDSEHDAGLLVPLAYSFPTAGKLLALLFVPFGAWYVGQALSPAQLPVLISAGILSLFGSPVAALPFLLDLFRLPADLFDLFLISGVVSARLSDAVGAMHLMAFTLITGGALAGTLEIRLRRVAGGLLAGGLAVVVAIVGLRAATARSYADPQQADVLGQMELSTEPVSCTTLDAAAPNPVPLREGEGRLERIRRCGVLRVGSHPDVLPFAFLNDAGEPVGFDIEMAHLLARHLGVRLELVPMRFDHLADQLDADHFDVAMAGIPGDYTLLDRVRTVDSGIDVHGSLLVPDHRRDDVASVDAIARAGHLRFGVLGESRVSPRIGESLPGVELVHVESPVEFLNGDREDLDGLVFAAEIGAAWTLRYPGFAVVVPDGLETAVPLVYPVARDAVDLESFLEGWAELSSRDGTTASLYRHWVLGQGARRRGPRWSVVRDVLHWVE